MSENTKTTEFDASLLTDLRYVLKAEEGATVTLSAVPLFHVVTLMRAGIITKATTESGKVQYRGGSVAVDAIHAARGVELKGTKGMVSKVCQSVDLFPTVDGVALTDHESVVDRMIACEAWVRQYGSPLTAAEKEKAPAADTLEKIVADAIKRAEAIGLTAADLTAAFIDIAEGGE